MKIVADENIPCVREAFSTVGEVITVQGRSLSAAEVRDADVLLVRSVTRVGAGLLAGSRVRFVASATIGFDHIDALLDLARGGQRSRRIDLPGGVVGLREGDGLSLWAADPI